jgi:hypothetical protein
MFKTVGGENNTRRGVPLSLHNYLSTLSIFCAGPVCFVGLAVQAPCVLWGWLCGPRHEKRETRENFDF